MKPQSGGKKTRRWPVLVGAVVFGLAAAAAVPEEVRKFHQEALVCDLHADTQFLITYMKFDLAKRHWTVPWGPAGVAPMFSDLDIPRMQEGGLDLFTMAICPSPKNNKLPGAAAFVRRSLAAIERTLTANADALALARSATEARSIIASGRIAVLLQIEGGQAIENDLSLLEEFYNRGVRSMTLTHQKSLDWAESSGDAGREDFEGLTNFGREVVRQMERRGMIIDLAHTAEATFWAVLETVNCPVMVTHAGARALGDHPRNLTDEQILALAARGGVVGVIYHVGYLDPEGKKSKTVSLVADHIDYIKQLAGVDVIALGSDFDGSVFTPPDLADASMLPHLTAELFRRGYSEEEIRKILGANFLRAWEEIEKCGQEK